jgi:hypothetical protein
MKHGMLTGPHLRAAADAAVKKVAQSSAVIRDMLRDFLLRRTGERLEQRPGAQSSAATTLRLQNFTLRV